LSEGESKGKGFNPAALENPKGGVRIGAGNSGSRVKPEASFKGCKQNEDEGKRIKVSDRERKIREKILLWRSGT
jgi:hypothetical protein